MICDDIIKIICLSVMFVSVFTSLAIVFVYYGISFIKDFFVNKRNDKFLNKLANLRDNIPHHSDYIIDNLELKMSSLDSRLSLLESSNYLSSKSNKTNKRIKK